VGLEGYFAVQARFATNQNFGETNHPRRNLFNYDPRILGRNEALLRSIPSTFRGMLGAIARKCEMAARGLQVYIYIFFFF